MMQKLRSDAVRLRRCSWMVGLLLLACSGCNTHEQDGDHQLEHHIPAHKPASFAEAVSELRSRGLAMQGDQATDEENHELLDIINWLPELAADSDLNRSQWEQVRDSVAELRTIATDFNDKSHPRWNELIRELDALIPDSDLWKKQKAAQNDSESTSGDESTEAPHRSEEVHHD